LLSAYNDSISHRLFGFIVSPLYASPVQQQRRIEWFYFQIYELGSQPIKSIALWYAKLEKFIFMIQGMCTQHSEQTDFWRLGNRWVCELERGNFVQNLFPMTFCLIVEFFAFRLWKIGSGLKANSDFPFCRRSLFFLWIVMWICRSGGKKTTTTTTTLNKEHYIFSVNILHDDHHFCIT
jgi:hypothetical protein